MCGGAALCLIRERVWVRSGKLKHFICTDGEIFGSRERVSIISN